MKSVFVYGFAMLMALSLCACHAVGPAAPTTGDTAPTVPASVRTDSTAATDPTDPVTLKDPVEEAREDGLVYIPGIYRFYSDNYAYIQLQFLLSEECYPGMHITYDVSANYGTLRTRAPWEVLSGPLDNHRMLDWTEGSEADLAHTIETDGAVFVDVVIRADGKIVGYGIFEIGTDDGTWLALMRSETVCFPMIDGQLQEVTEEYVAAKLAECRQTITPFNREEKQAEEDAYWAAFWEEYNKGTAPAEDPT